MSDTPLPPEPVLPQHDKSSADHEATLVLTSPELDRVIFLLRDARSSARHWSDDPEILRKVTEARERVE